MKERTRETLASMESIGRHNLQEQPPKGQEVSLRPRGYWDVPAATSHVLQKEVCLHPEY